MPTLWALTAEYGSISVGDDLPILVKFAFRPPAQDGDELPQEDPVNTEKLTDFVRELLLKAFPPDSVNNENTAIEAEILAVFLPGDTVSLTGAVVGKTDAAGEREVECRVTVESHEGDQVATARAKVRF